MRVEHHARNAAHVIESVEGTGLTAKSYED